jgi:hypothetical protein
VASVRVPGPVGYPIAAGTTKYLARRLQLS